MATVEQATADAKNVPNLSLKDQASYLWGQGYNLDEIQRVLNIKIEFKGSWPSPAFKSGNFTVEENK